MYDSNLAEEKVLRQPELQNLVQIFSERLATLELLSSDIETKLQKIKSYTEPSNEVQKINELTESEDTFSFSLKEMLNSFNKYNSRLEKCLRHLNEII